MSKDIEKFTNWRAITESDYVTMFIKTWFAFVATLRELYPKDNLDEVIGKGDSAFLNPYLHDFAKKFVFYNDIEKIKSNILRVYKLGRVYTLENKKYNRFFVEDFYTLNKDYYWKNITEDYECSIRYDSDIKIAVHVKYYDKSLYQNNSPLVISTTIDIADLVSSENLSEKQIQRYINDEASFINDFVENLTKRVSLSFVKQITDGKYTKIFSQKTLALLNSLTLLINRDLIYGVSLMKDATVKREELLFVQNPCANFVYKMEQEEEVSAVNTYTWFLKFVYFMRNALFHEIIDPLDNFWQEIFKHSYLALKEILDGNISFFFEKGKITKVIHRKVFDEFLAKSDVYIPNLVDEYNNGELEIKITEYIPISDGQVNKREIKALITYDYWYSDKTIRYIKCKSNMILTINNDDFEFEKFKMELVDVKDESI